MNISVVRPMAAASMLLAMLCAAPVAFAIDTGDIVVDSVKGEVRVTMNGAATPVRTGSVLELPATIKTGRDGALELRQGATTVSVGPETTLEFPALEERGGPIDRIVQPRGNAFYSIGKRPGHRLRVETPYLVGVIKGTQFNVAAQDESTTISLFEGLLEVHATDESSVIDLKAGEIASRKRGDKTISVVKMDSGKAPPTRPAPGATRGSNDSGTSAPGLRPTRTDDEDSVLADRGVDLQPVEAEVDTHVDLEARGGAGGTNLTAGVSLGNAVETGVSVATNPASGAAASTAAGTIAAGPATVDVSAATGINPGAAAVDLAASTKIDAAPLTTAASAVTAVEVAAGNVSANVGLSTAATVGSVAAVNTAVDAGANIAAGSANANVGLSTTAAVGSVAAVNTAVGAGANVAAGNVNANAGLSTTAAVGSVAAVSTAAVAAVDLGAKPNVAANTAIATNVAGVAATVSTTANVATGNVDLGASVAGVNLNAGIDLGLGKPSTTHTSTSTGAAATPGTTTTTTAAPVIDTGGLLESLLHRSRKK